MRLFALILILTLLLQLWLPWWTVMAVPFAACFWMAGTARQAFAASFLAVFLLWLGASLFFHLRSGGILSERVSALLHVGSPLLLILITALTGALAAGAAGWAGLECSAFFRKPRRPESAL